MTRIQNFGDVIFALYPPQLVCPASVDVDEAFAGLLDELRCKIASADEFRRVREDGLRVE